MDPKEHIQLIRRKYTGENSTINSDGEMVVENLTQMLTSAISELAKNIYKKDSHFIMELIQNADDNEYNIKSIPTLKITQNNDRVIFQNNEVGFNKENIESICSISNSTKSSTKGVKGYIGEKGIGFKSVFRVCNEPEIYSNGYQFKFNSNANLNGKKKEIKLGYILPEWINEPNIDVLKSYTNIVLPFKQTLSFEEKKRLADIKPDLLLFLNKLKKLDITDEFEDKRVVVEKKIKDNIISLQQTQFRNKKREKSVNKEYILFDRGNIKVPTGVQVEQRKNINSTRIVLAFPLDGKSNLKTDEEQSLYSYLPINNSGFRFLIQADFILTSGRESIDEDNPWNIWIKEEIVTSFNYAVEEFKKQPKYKYSFINFIPLSTESFSDFFQPVADEIIDNCRSAKIVLSESDKWCNTDDVLFGESGEHILFDNALLKAATKKEYLNKRYTFNEELFETLQINTFSDSDLFNCLDTSSLLKKKNDQWFLDLYNFLSKKENKEEIAREIRDYKIVPLNNKNIGANQLAIPHKDSIFFPIDQEINYVFEKSINIISKELYNKINLLKEKKLKNRIIDFLNLLGVRKPTPYTIVKNYILKKYETEEWKSYKQQVLIEHLVFIKHHWSDLKNHQDEIIDLLSDKSIIHCKSNGDDKNYFSKPENVYISENYGNKNNIESLFSGIENVWFINECYLKQDKTGKNNKAGKIQKTKEWYVFFKALGCREIPDLKDSISEQQVLKLIDTGNPVKINQLLLILEKYWNEYKKHTETYIYNSITKRNNLLVKKSWFKKLTEEKVIPVGKKLYYAKEIYIKEKKIISFFGNSVTYFERKILPDFAEKLGFNLTVDSTSVVRYLKEQSEKETKLQKEKAVQLYKYLLYDDNADLSDFDNESLIYLTGKNEWYSKDEVFWTDYSYLIGSDFGYCVNNFPLVLKELFVDRIKIKEAPGINDYLNTLKKINTQSIERALKESQQQRVYKIFAELGSFALRYDIDDFILSEMKEYIWTNKQEFWKNDNDIFYNDNQDLYNLYKEEESIAFFEIPKTLLPKTKKLLNLLGVPSISEALVSEIINIDNATLNQKLTIKIRSYADTIIALIYSEHISIYEENTNLSLFDKLKNIEIYESPELEVKYTLNNICKYSNTDSFNTDDCIYISRDNRDKNSSIAYGITKILNAPQIFEFVLLLLTVPKNTINFIFKQKNITPPPDESTVLMDEPDDEMDMKDSNDDYFTDDSTEDLPENNEDDSDTTEEENQESSAIESIVKVSNMTWKPEICVTENTVEIEQYEEQFDDDIDTDKEGRTFNKSSFISSSSNNRESTVLSQKVKEQIGDYGEEKVYLELIRLLKEKYPAYVFHQDNRNQVFRITNNRKQIAELKWLNFKGKIQEGYDLVLIENSKKKFFEVKTTTGDERIVFTVSPQQWMFIKQKEENYSIFRVINAGKENMRLIEINNPYRLWMDGKLKVYPINIEL